MRTIRAIALIVLGVAIGVGLGFGSGQILSAQGGPGPDTTRLQVSAKGTTAFLAGNLRFKFVQDTKTGSCYMVGVDKDSSTATAITQAPLAACE